MKKTEYCYDDRSFRLNVLRTTRNNGQDTLQDLNYYYDAVGNIVGEADYAQQIFYFANQEVEPVFNYTYDPLYRLLTATGREMTALQMPTHEDFPNNIPCPNPGPDAMQNYTQNYQYDALGNILQMQSVGNWTRNYEYNNPMNNNYLLGHGDGTVYTYDTHGNMLTMPHLSNISWDYLDQLHSASNGTFTSYYNYDAEGNRSRKVVVKNNIREERYYVNGYEIYRKYTNDVLDFERKTINISDDEKVFVRIEQKTGENPVIRYQYDNHLGSACLELDELGAIISYEEYHPFGTTSYRSGRTETEVSLKRYKYCGKERDEETGLYYYGMRYYAAWLCRFVSVDPLQFKYPHYTPYQYAGNKPITFIDLDGGEEADPETGKIQGTIYLRFDVDLSQEDKNTYIQNFKQNIIDTWGQEQHQYNGMTVNVDDIEVMEASSEMTESDLNSGESLLMVGFGDNAKEETIDSNVSYINKDRKTGYMYYQNAGREAGHELGHILGLSDRYIRLLKYDKSNFLHDAGSIPLYLKDGKGRSNMMMGNGSNNLTQKQLSIVFSHKQEKVYHVPVLIEPLSNNTVSEGTVAKANRYHASIGKINSQGDFYKTEKISFAFPLLGQIMTSYSMGPRYTKPPIGSAHKNIFHSSDKVRNKTNANLVKFFSR